jgi:hypothetical protein
MRGVLSITYRMLHYANALINRIVYLQVKSWFQPTTTFAGFLS